MKLMTSTVVGAAVLIGGLWATAGMVWIKEWIHEHWGSNAKDMYMATVGIAALGGFIGFLWETLSMKVGP